MTERRASYTTGAPRGEDALDWHLCALRVPVFKRQYRFAKPERNWLADFAWPEYRLIVEVDGAVWARGRHTRGSGRVKDMERDNWCALHGWRVLRYTTAQAEDGTAAAEIAAFLEGENAKT